MRSRFPALLTFAILLAAFTTDDAQADVVHLADGRSLFGSVSEANGTVVVTTSAGMVELDPAEVLRIENSRHLEAALARALARVDGNDPDALLLLGDWAVRKGLFEDGLDLADRALLAAQRRADTNRSDLDLPESLYGVPFKGIDERCLDATSAWRLLSMTSGRKPARAKVAAVRLDKIVRTQDITDTLLRGLRDASPNVRISALQLLSVTTPEGTIERVIERMLFDQDAAVRAAAVRAVRAYENDGVVYPLARALRNDNEALRATAMDAIEALDERRAIAALIANLRRASGGLVRNNLAVTTQTSFVKDFDVEIAQAAVIAQPIVGVITHGSVLDVGVAGVHSKRVIGAAERQRIVRVLAHLTGYDFGGDADRWQHWLDEQHDG